MKEVVEQIVKRALERTLPTFFPTTESTYDSKEEHPSSANYKNILKSFSSTSAMNARI